MTDKPLTGRKVFFIFAAFFGVIIAVNLTLAFQAVATFPGLEVRNAYVASQSFDTERAAQTALGWDVSATVVDQQLILTINDVDGQPVQVADLSAILGRATHVKDDLTPAFEFNGSAYVAPADIATGNWNLRLVAHASDGTRFSQRVIIHVSN
ncbi:MAG: FixH family protein [Paracoccaceae bacterium]